MALYSTSPPGVIQGHSGMMNMRTSIPGGSDVDGSMRKPATSNHAPPQCSKATATSAAAISGGLSHMFSLPSSTSKLQHLSSQCAMASGVCATSSDQACDLGSSSSSDISGHGHGGGGGGGGGGGIGMMSGGSTMGVAGCCVGRDFVGDGCRGSAAAAAPCASSASSPFSSPMAFARERSPVSVLLGVGGSCSSSASRIGSYSSAASSFGSPSSSLSALHIHTASAGGPGGGGFGSLPSSFDNGDRLSDRLASSPWNSRRSGHGGAAPDRRLTPPSRATAFGFPAVKDGGGDKWLHCAPSGSLGGVGGEMVDIHMNVHSLRLSSSSSSFCCSDGGGGSCSSGFSSAAAAAEASPPFFSCAYGGDPADPSSATPARSVAASAVPRWGGRGVATAAVTVPTPSPLLRRDDADAAAVATLEPSEVGVGVGVGFAGGCSSPRSIRLDDVLGWNSATSSCSSAATVERRESRYHRGECLTPASNGNATEPRRVGVAGRGPRVGAGGAGYLPRSSSPSSPPSSSPPLLDMRTRSVEVAPPPAPTGRSGRVLKEDDTSSQLNRVVVRRLLLRAQSRHKLFYDPLVKRAFNVAATAHEGQMRLNGDPYLSHCVETAIVLAETCNDKVLVAAGLLHDTLDDSMMNERQLQEMFGSDITNLVTGVSKMSHISQLARERQAPLGAREAERLRNMFLAMADYRVVLIKLADRLHNMRTLEVLPPAKRQRLSEETLDIFAPLANRLGVWSWKAELEDLCFMYLQPETYRELVAKLRDSHRGDSLMTAMRQMDEGLRESGVAYEDLCGRPKNLFSIWTKMKNKGRGIDEIFDVRGLRLIVHNESDCYAALEVVRGLWKEVPGRSKDYIKNPKGNGYQSLHTIVSIEDGRPLELQIRTVDMHQRAEFGMAAHWRYKEEVGDNYPLHVAQKVQWARCLLTWKNEMDRKLRLAPHEGGSVRKPCPFPEHLSECPYGKLGAPGSDAENNDDPLFIIMLEGDLMQVQELPGGSTASDLVSERVLGMSSVMDTPPGVIRPLVNHYLVEDLSQKLHTGDLVEFVAEPELEPTLSPILPLHGIAQRGAESAKAAELAVEFERQRLSRWFRVANGPHQVEGRRKGRSG
ncbi:hypothetical protein CBR_g16012 [Chara braunii]|uniref:GTP diphosphokinase n=1 Tax=Chara braunii TaxID=69332 RepID=A0A388JT57_CHABU|nr:hypothetical protein CBR_g16012 [Chara braunii]|eukprot:GBG60892.1 hypothetical protein CBR_g16012 [Chara braunii]